MGEQLARVRDERLEQRVLRLREVHGPPRTVTSRRPRDLDVVERQGRGRRLSGLARRIAARSRARTSSTPNGFVT